jgi:hypothetical protein
MHCLTELRVLRRLITESFVANLQAAFNDVIDTDDSALEGGLDDANASMRRWGNEPYADADEMRSLDPSGFESMVSRLKARMAYVVKNLETGERGVVAYRALTLDDPDAFVEKLRRGGAFVGKYWSFNQRGARPYWGKTAKKTVMVVAEVPVGSVDVLATVKANTSRAFSNNEDELTLVVGEPIYVLTVDDQRVNAVNVA